MFRVERWSNISTLSKKPASSRCSESRHYAWIYSMEEGIFTDLPLRYKKISYVLWKMKSIAVILTAQILTLLFLSVHLCLVLLSRLFHSGLSIIYFKAFLFLRATRSLCLIILVRYPNNTLRRVNVLQFSSSNFLHLAAIHFLLLQMFLIFILFL